MEKDTDIGGPGGRFPATRHSAIHATRSEDAGERTRGFETLVAGAGISGLTYAEGLGRRADVLVIDAAERPGGLVRTARGPDPATRYEHGPEAISDPRGELGAWARALGIEVREAPAELKRRYLVHEGALCPVPLSPPALMSFSRSGARACASTGTSAMAVRSAEPRWPAISAVSPELRPISSMTPMLCSAEAVARISCTVRIDRVIAVGKPMQTSVP